MRCCDTRGWLDTVCPSADDNPQNWFDFPEIDMTTQRSSASLAVLAALAACAFTATPALALYKVVGPDGKITYTDRPAVGVENKVQQVNNRGSVSNDAALPYELRQVAQRYPVTLYTTTDCAPCDAGRQHLRTRGVPFSERSIVTAQDTEALQRLVGTTSLPVVSIGAQIVRGLQPTTWDSYLDAAGYPKESKLPANFPVGTAEPLTTPPVAAPASAPAPRRPAPAPAPAPQEPPSKIRF
jgi:glutaredoxin